MQRVYAATLLCAFRNIVSISVIIYQLHRGQYTGDMMEKPIELKYIGE
jgi:hypothetical protein